MTIHSMSSHPGLQNLLVVGIPFSDEQRKRLEPYFTNITHVQGRDKTVSDKELAEADVIYGFPADNARAVSQVPKLQFIQLSSAGSERLLASPLWKDEASRRIKIASAAGVHTSPIPQVHNLIQICCTLPVRLIS